MQLWRCLYAVKKKNDSNDMVPFRESKLTHILMPTLYRVGTCGAAMIACVNPQSADYDETISVLGNASLACEVNVKEIVPVEKVAKPILRKLGSRSSVASRHSVSSSHSGSTASSTASATAAATSAVVPVVLNAKESRKRKVATTTAEVTESTTKATKAAKNNADEMDALHKEIDRLKAANKELETAQMTREQEIRAEVCEEMAKYSQNLLDQIQELQDEIYELKTLKAGAHKSVKKAKREQRSLEHEESIKNLADSEEEMERQKRYYDAEIKSLKQEIRASKIEIADWKVQAASSNENNTTENSAQNKLKRKPLGTISPNVSPSQETDVHMKSKKDKRSTSPYRETDGSGHPGIAPPNSPKMVGSGPFFSRTMRSTTVRI
jgi:myosin heavy subunit